MPRRSFFTTFEISQICEVNPTTVQNWVKEKKLKAFVTPGGHRRIRRDDLLSFLQEFKMPIPEELAPKPPLIMIVDDEKEVLDLLTSVMESGDEPLEVACAESGVEALLKIGERTPDLLILDIKMPGMNGFEVCQKLRSNSRSCKIKIVGISGDTDPATRARILEAGADLFFNKPLNVLDFRKEALKLIGY
jgi:excisionase family DNA binding protein